MLALYDVDMLAGRKEEARKRMEDATAKYPKAPTFAVLLGMNYLDAGNPTKVLEVTREAIGANPDNLELLSLRGDAYLGIGDGGGALTAFALSAVQPNSAEAYYSLAKAYAANRTRSPSQRVIKP